MRDQLTKTLKNHLGNFLNCPREDDEYTSYFYRPIPRIKYKNLDHDFFCHNYYLQNLCDVEKFKEWEINEPIAVFNASVKAWQKMDEQQETKQEVEEARAVFGIEDIFEIEKLDNEYIKLREKYYTDIKVSGYQLNFWLDISLQNATDLLLRTMNIEKKDKRSSVHTKYCNHFRIRVAPTSNPHTLSYS